MAYNRINYLERVKEIQAFARERYEPGRQDRCWRWVWSHHVKARYHIDYQTFLNMLKIDVDGETAEARRRLAEKSLRNTLFEGMDL